MELECYGGDTMSAQVASMKLCYVYLFSMKGIVKPMT
jgi:hypothetical protein